MSALDIEKERRDFEAAARANPYACYGFASFGAGIILNPSRTYLDTKTEAAWGIWLAAKRAAQPAPSAVTVSGGDGLDARIQQALDLLADATLPSGIWRDVSNVLHACRDAVKAAGQGENDARLLAWAISREDNAEALYAAVMNHGSDTDAIRTEISAIAAKEGSKHADSRLPFDALSSHYTTHC
jgi:hypothetical protein